MKEILTIIKNNKRIRLLVIASVAILLTFAIGYTFALFSSNKKVISANIKVNDLSYRMTINEGTGVHGDGSGRIVNDRIIRAEKGKTSSYTISLLSLNSINTKYGLKYKVCSAYNTSTNTCTSYYSSKPTNLKIYIASDTEADSTETINANSTKNIKVVVENNESAEKYIEFQLDAGYTWNTLTYTSPFTDGQHSGSGAGGEMLTVRTYLDGELYESLAWNSGKLTNVTCYKSDGVTASSADVAVDNQQGTYKANITNVIEPTICNAYFGTAKEFDYTGGEQTYIAPKSGYYKLEVWGAQGGSYGNIGGYGGYSSGVVRLTVGSTLNVVVGGQAVGIPGGYNGGGGGAARDHSMGGGGASHIATRSGVLSSLSSYKSDILIVAGGGGGSQYWNNVGSKGGDGGGYCGVRGSYNGASLTNSYGGTQSSGGAGARGAYNGSDGSFGMGGNGNTNNYGGGGGGGWYGGGGGTATNGGVGSGAGGSGYIGNSNLYNKLMYCYNCATSSGTSTKTNTGTCISSSPTANCAKEGNGYASITYIASEIEIDPNYSIDYTGGEQTYTVPKTGYYTLEVWGAQGGSYGNIGGYGGYSSGVVRLTVGSTLNVVVGGQAVGIPGGYNGGGSGATNANSMGGGGASHIATRSGLLSSLSSYKSDILIIAGGGGGSQYYQNVGSKGGDGGGYCGVGGSYNGASLTNSYGGTQSSGGAGARGAYNGSDGSFGMGGNANTYGGGGGGGWYGGGGGTATNGGVGSGAGGSGYIGNSLLTDKLMYCYNCATSSDASTKTNSGTCVSSSPTANCAKEGNGYARITYIG